jgi:hypothetical protein
MIKMPRYDMNVLLRTNGEDDVAEMERAIRSNVTATCELAARRVVLERAWESGLLVIRFISIKKKSTK